mmetsp:Transcript_2495/g.7425  ORF Transcript_2495/g.7425 Transcript_2495/m.7425 type:complete len:214 (-) Transcript_2495:681-1322(-)
MSHLFGTVRTATALSGSTGFPMESSKLMPPPSGALPPDEGILATCCWACMFWSRSRHAGSRKMAHSATRPWGAPCGFALEVLMMILFCRAAARHWMMWSTSKPARHSRICALSSDCASFDRRGGEKPVVPQPFRLSPIFAMPPRPGAGTDDGAPIAGRAVSTAAAASANSSGVKARPLPKVSGVPSACASSGICVASGRMILSASAQSLCVSS